MTDERAGDGVDTRTDRRVDDVVNPRLADDEIAALEPLGARVRLHDGEPLFRTGVRRGGFFVVLSGAVEVLDRSGDVPRRVALHHAGQFTGDIDILARRAPLVTTVARGASVRCASSPVARSEDESLQDKWSRAPSPAATGLFSHRHSTGRPQPEATTSAGATSA